MKILGIILMIAGGMIAGLCNKIVSPGLEVVLGIERIVGKENVVYLDGGGYVFTNPEAMVKWIASVALIGIAILGFGARIYRRKRDSKGQQGQAAAQTGSDRK
jgi:hypothetical protein